MSRGTNVAIFERQYRVMLTERESNRLDLPGKFCRTLILGKLLLVTVFVWNYFYFIVYLDFWNFWKSSLVNPLTQPHQILNEWTMNFSAEKKKNTLCFFFPAIFLTWEKKKSRFLDLNEWMTNRLFRVKKKIRYLWLTNHQIKIHLE